MLVIVKITDAYIALGGATTAVSTFDDVKYCQEFDNVTAVPEGASLITLPEASNQII